jgi:hypothetical protein
METIMTTFRRLMIALLSGAVLFTGTANATSTTNYSDQWWIPSESGWGASVLQQWDTLFIDIFVYGADNKPTWFTGAAYYQSNSPSGHVVFTGDLYATTGPYYGGSFNPAAVALTKVGTLTFDSDTTNTATLSYTVNGVPVTKSVTRQTWRNENLAGSYYGGSVWDATGCKDPADNDHYEIYGAMQITHAGDNTVRITLQVTTAFNNGAPIPVPPNSSASIVGTYTQSGHMGQVPGTVTFVLGTDTGTEAWNVFEIERGINGIMARLASAHPDSDGCSKNGRFGGVRR